MLHERYRAQLIDDLCRLIRIPSRSSAAGGEEGTLQRIVAEEMRQLGARVRTFEPDDIPEFRGHPLCCGPERDYSDRPTVVGELGPAGAPALLVAAHSDTVSIFEPDEWTFDPFLGEVRDGFICGLGSNDDKWGTATMLTVMRALGDAGAPLTKRLIFASTIDEENGVGNGLLLLMLAGIEAEAALYLDGSDMNVCIGNSGGSNLYLRPKATLDQPTLDRHGELLKDACASLSTRRDALFAREFFEGSPARSKSVMLHRRQDERGPFFLLAFYTVPGEGKEICRELEAAVAEALGDDAGQYDQSYREPWFEPSLLSRDAGLTPLVAQSMCELRGEEPRVTVVSKQDVFVLNNHAGIPTVSFGIARPGGRGAFHQPDESARVEDVWAGCQVAYDVVCCWRET